MTVDLIECRICYQELLPNPLFMDSGAKYCLDHGDYFILRMRRRRPVVVYRAYDSEPEMPPEFTMKPPQEIGRVGNPGLIVECNQTGQRFPSVFRACQVMNLPRGSVSKHINGKQRSVQGYTFTVIGDNI